MKRWQFIFILLQISETIRTYPLEQSDLEDPELSEIYYQGDIESFPTLMNFNGARSETFRWPNGIVYYKIDHGQFDQDQWNQIQHAMYEISQLSCIKFELYYPGVKTFLNITSQKPGCSVNKLGWGQNEVRTMNLKPGVIGTGCFRLGTILHELLHVLGFHHQHVAANRDEYINVNWDNIRPKFKMNFFHDHRNQLLGNFGEDYDYNSVMHYARNAFSINRGSQTLEPKKEGSENMGQRIHLSRKDIIKLNRMYKCPGYV